MNERKESVVLCEGYHDRAFWSGLLLHLGCADPGMRPGLKERVPIHDPWGKLVSRGQFAYRSVSGRFIRVIPCHGKDKVLPIARSILQRRTAEPVERLVVCLDSDQNADGSPASAKLVSREALEQAVKSLDPSVVATQGGDFSLDGGKTLISPFSWEHNCAHGPGLPNQQTLERLVCGAVLAVYPERATVVERWLSSRPNGPTPGAKEYGWSYMAGWYAESGCEAFFSSLWGDAGVAAAFQDQLRSSGAWRVVEFLAM